jgi:hypothetical protein
VNQPVDSRSVTFDVLARNKSDEAGDVLMHAMGCDDKYSRRLAAETIIKRQSQQSILEIIRRVATLDDKACNEFSHAPDRFTTVLAQCFLILTTRQDCQQSSSFVARPTSPSSVACWTCWRPMSLGFPKQL